MKYITRSIILAMSLLLIERLSAVDLHVAPSGNDANPGTVDRPFATLTKARDAIRTLKSSAGLPAGGINVWLRAGQYDFSGTVSFDGRDAGEANKPIVYAAWPEEYVTFTGGRTLPANGFYPVTTNMPAWARLDPAARGNVYAMDLRANGINDLGTLKPRGFGLHNSAPLEIFADSRPMTLARWPNREAPMVRTVTAPSLTRITYAGSRAERWTQADEVWLNGFWASTWADFHVRAAGINVAAKSIDFAQAPAQFGVEAGRLYFAYNLLEEIDEPGEYYVDRRTGMLYFWPVVPLTSAPIQASLLESALLQLNGTQYLTFRDLVIEVSRGPLVEISGGNGNRIERCVLRNAGQYAARVSGTNNGLQHCEIADCGEDGVLLSGGDRASLTTGNNYVTHSHIERTGRISLSYHPAINLVGGCGNLATNNLIGDLTHSAILFSGNLHRIELNEIRRVCQMTSDAGAIYSGRDWSYRGNIIRYNFIHHISSVQDGNGVHGVYLDDGMSSALVYGNVFYKIAGAGIFCGGGRDNIMRNNLMAECEMGHYNGDYAREHFNNTPGSSWNVLERLAADGIKYQQNPWAAAFPELKVVPNSWPAAQSGLWRNPVNCVFADNAGWANGTWMFETNFSGTGIFSVYALIANNQANQVPLFNEDASLDRARRATTLQAAVPNFAPIPFAAIGPVGSSVSVSAAPSAPLLTVKPLSSSALDLRWTSAGHLAARRETGFAVEQRVGAQAAWTVVQSLAATADFAHVTGLAPATAYAFRVKASNAAGTVYSNVLAITTEAAPLVIGPAVRFEAEQNFSILADLGGNGSVGASNATLDSGQSLRLFDVGDGIRLPFTVTTSGLYRIGLRARSGDAAVPVGKGYWPGGYTTRLDGGEIALVGDATSISPIDNSYGPTYWGTMYSGAVWLSAGTHSFEVVAALNWAVVDYLEIAPLGTAQIKTFGDWRKANFTATQLNDAAISGAMAQPAGDGVTNLMKYALGLDPWRPLVGSLAQISTVGGALRIEYARAPGITDVSYAVEVSDDQQQWIQVPQVVLGQNQGLEVMQATDTSSVPRRAIRIAIEGPNGAAYSEVFSVVPNSSRIEVENVFSIVSEAGSNGPIAVHDSVLDSNRSVSLFDPGDSIHVPFTVPSPGSYRINIRLRTGDASSVTAYWPNGYQYRVDGTTVQFQGASSTLSGVDASYGPCYWGTVTAALRTLTAGNHVLEIGAARAWGVVDYVEVSPAGALRIEAEAPLNRANDVGSNGAIQVLNASLDSGESVSLFDVSDAVRLTFPVTSPDPIQLAVRVRAGDGSGATAYWPGGYAFKLDGTPVTLVGDNSTLSAIESAFGPTTWGTMLGTTSGLSTGIHTLEVTATRAWAAVDFMEISAASTVNTRRIEVESALSVVRDVGGNGAVAIHNASFDSGESVSLFDVSDAVRISIPIAASGTTRIAVRVRAGDGGSPTAFWSTGYGFKIDAQTINLVGDPATLSAREEAYGPTYWGTMVGSVALSAGTHTLEIAANRAWGVADYVEVSAPAN